MTEKLFSKLNFTYFSNFYLSVVPWEPCYNQLFTLQPISLQVHTVKAGRKRGAISTSKQRFVGSLFISSSFGEQRTWEQKIGRKRAINWRIAIKLKSFDESSSKIERYGSRSGLIAILGQQVLHVILRENMLPELENWVLIFDAKRSLASKNMRPKTWVAAWFNKNNRIDHLPPFSYKKNLKSLWPQN